MNSKSESESSVVVFIPAPGIGHLVSTLEFAKLLINRTNHLSATILCLNLGFSSPETTAFTKFLAGDQITLTDLPPPSDPPTADPQKSIENFIYNAVESAIPQVRLALKDLADRSRIAAVILDFFCMPLLDVAAGEQGLSSYMFMTSNLGFVSLMMYLPGRDDRVGGAEFEKPNDGEFIDMPGFENRVPVGVLPSAVFNKEGGYSSYVKLARRFRDVKGIIVNSFAELEGHRDGETPATYLVGPVLDLKGRAHPNLDASERNKIISWLDKQPPSSVVFLCFGSFGSFTAPQLLEIASGLEQSNHRFLWSARSSEPGKSLKEILPEEFSARAEGRGMVLEGWAPQAEVLGHAAVGGFVSHCGWNSVLEGLWHGVPSVTWPLYAEQQMNAFRMAREFRLAVELRVDFRISGGEVVSAEEVCEAVRRVMEDGVVRERVKEMSLLARKAVAHGGSSFVAVDRLIHDLLRNNSNDDK